MTAEQAAHFAQAWAAQWNSRDVEAVLAHFADDVTFTSPVALKVTGHGTVIGKAALREYWTTALAQHVLRFHIVRTLWDATAAELAIVYDREINGRHERAVEVLLFGPDGKVVRGEAFYGVVPQADPPNES
jgi:ketosteroid isomerase-like protein